MADSFLTTWHFAELGRALVAAYPDLRALVESFEGGTYRGRDPGPLFAEAFASRTAAFGPPDHFEQAIVFPRAGLFGLEFEIRIEPAEILYRRVDSKTPEAFRIGWKSRPIAGRVPADAEPVRFRPE